MTDSATERVGRYQLLDPIGGGPNGMVARAKVFGVAGFERQFAVKRFIPELTVGPAAQALSAAARSYGSLEHPRIARMSEYGVAQGQTFTAVEYVAGLDVFRLLQEAKLASVAIAAGGALALVSQAARAVGYAHGRGLSHLGLSPTNVIVTADGDVKVTDFGVLAATMPARPAESQRLASRVPYLAPEQISGEATSAATDVFVLGVIAYELVTGQRAYRGENAAAVAQAILAGPPIEPALPRPIVRVLQRCLARSPFERFPDARALADALDAALRVAPVPGTRKDVGAQVKTTLERYAHLNEGNVSGMVALGTNTAPSPGVVSSQPVRGRPEARTEPSPMPTFASASAPAPARSSGLSGPAGSTLHDMPKPMATIAGLAPPPIAVPTGVSSPGSSSPTIPTGTNTILGMPAAPAAKKPPIPSIPKIGGPPPGPPSRPTPAPAPAAKTGALTQGWDAQLDLEASVPAKVGSLTQGWDAMPEPMSLDAALAPAGPASGPTTIPDPIASIADEAAFELRDDEPLEMQALAPASPPVKRPTPGQSFDSETGEMSAAQLDALTKRAQLSTAEMTPMQKREVSSAHDAVTKPVGAATLDIAVARQNSPSVGPPPSDSRDDFAVDPPQVSAGETLASETMPGHAAPRNPVSQSSLDSALPSVSVPGTSAPSASTTAAHPPAPAQSSRLPLIAGIVLGIGILGAGGVFAYNELIAKKSDEATTVATTTPVSAPADAALPGVATPDAAAVVAEPMAALDAAVAASERDASVEADAAVVATAPPADAAAAVVAPPADAAAAVATNDTGTNTQVAPARKSDQLEVVTTPPGARVFLDGAELGKTPLKQPGSADRHTLAVLLPDHALYLAEVDGAGVYSVTLDPVKLPKSGPGIKIETCKAKNRYYIYVDGQPSGQTCPTAKRIVVSGLGPHTVEVYDIVTEARKKYDVDIKDDRLSVRVKIDE